MTEMGFTDPGRLLTPSSGALPSLVARKIQQADDRAAGPRLTYGLVTARSTNTFTATVRGGSVPSIPTATYLPLVGETAVLLWSEGGYLCIGTLTADTGWINLQLLNSWVNYDSGTTIGGSGRVCQIRRINGIVYYKGVARTGTAGTVGLVVPAGFRPETAAVYDGSWIVAGSAATPINLDASNGNMTLGNSIYTYLNGIAPYPAAQ